MDTKRDAVLKAIRFERPDYIPMTFHINRASWDYYDNNQLKAMISAHPFLFSDFDVSINRRKEDYGLNQRASEPYTDPWGCTWETATSGITGTVSAHPLASWDNFTEYRPPNGESTDGTFPVSWPGIAQSVSAKRKAGELVHLGLPHGHTFLRLQDIRGYENLMFDFADGHKNVCRLVEMVADFNFSVVERLVSMKPDIIGYAEDLGMQVGPMLSPEHFAKYIKPVYQRLMKPARDAGVLVHMHSDGDIRTLAADLVDGGVDVLNLQDLVNGIDWIADNFSGKTCIELDIDRQSITPGGSPAEVDVLIRSEVKKLSSREGGLMMVYGLYPGIPTENIAALMDAMEKYAGYYS